MVKIKMVKKFGFLTRSLDMVKFGFLNFFFFFYIGQQSLFALYIRNNPKYKVSMPILRPLCLLITAPNNNIQYSNLATRKIVYTLP